jgi:hypothetical protein
MQTLLSRDNQHSDDFSRNRSSQGHRTIIALLLVALTLALRFAPLPENFSAFGALAIFCGLYTYGAVRWWLPLLALFIADCIGHFSGIPGMGFYHLPSMALNYLGFASMTLVSFSMSKWALLASRSAPKAFASTAGVALVASFCFFLISNFGAWLDPQMQYQKTLSGLVNCYVAGLPFWRSTLSSDVLFTLGFSGFATLLSPVVQQLQVAREHSIRP